MFQFLSKVPVHGFRHRLWPPVKVCRYVFSYAASYVCSDTIYLNTHVAVQQHVDLLWQVLLSCQMCSVFAFCQMLLFTLQGCMACYSYNQGTWVAFWEFDCQIGNAMSSWRDQCIHQI